MHEKNDSMIGKFPNHFYIFILNILNTKLTNQYEEKSEFLQFKFEIMVLRLFIFLLFIFTLVYISFVFDLVKSYLQINPYSIEFIFFFFEVLILDEFLFDVASAVIFKKSLIVYLHFFRIQFEENLHIKFPLENILFF